MRSIKEKYADRLNEKGVSKSVAIERQAHTVIVVYDRLGYRHHEVVGSHFNFLAALAMAWTAHDHSLCARDSVRGVAVTVAVANAAAAAALNRTRRGVAVAAIVTTTTTTVVATKRRLVAVTVVAHSLYTQGSARGSTNATAAAAATSSTAAATATAASSTNQPTCWRTISASTTAGGSVTATTRGHRVGWSCRMSLSEIGREMLNCGTVSACARARSIKQLVYTTPRGVTAQTIANSGAESILVSISTPPSTSSDRRNVRVR